MFALFRHRRRQEAIDALIAHATEAGRRMGKIEAERECAATTRLLAHECYKRGFDDGHRFALEEDSAYLNSMTLNRLT